MPSVLIIDDDPAVLTALPETLRLWMPDLLIEISGSARLALERIEATEYDAIISDIRMPDMDGLTLLERIRALQPHTPTLLVTGYGDQTLATQALRGGAYDYILKPVDRDYLLSSLTRALQLRRLTRQASDRTRADLPAECGRASLQALMEIIPCLVIVVDADGRILFFNRAAEKTTGFRREEVSGTSLFQSIFPSLPDGDAKRRLLEETCLDPGFEHPCLTKSGSIGSVQWRCTPIAWDTSARSCFACVGVEMTHWREREHRIESLILELDQRAHTHGTGVQDSDPSNAALASQTADLKTMQDVIVEREEKLIALEKRIAELQQEMQRLRARRTAP
jgi:PAS domain S-box-containing protein